MASERLVVDKSVLDVMTRAATQSRAFPEYEQRIRMALGDDVLPIARQVAERVRGAEWCTVPQAESVVVLPAPAMPAPQRVEGSAVVSHAGQVARPSMTTPEQAPITWPLVKRVVMRPTNLVLLAVAAAVCAAFLYPPWMVTYEGTEVHFGFHYFAEPPFPLLGVNKALLALELGAIGFVGGVAYLIARRIEQAV